MTSPALTGTCACGLTTYTSTTPPLHLDYCYCLTCQRTSGAPFLPFIGLPISSLTWSGASPSSWRPKLDDGKTSIATRYFCGACGSSLSMQYDCYPDKVHVAAGTVVEGREKLPATATHIFVKRKPGWYRIPEDGGGRWEEFDPAFEEVLRRHLSGMGELGG